MAGFSIFILGVATFNAGCWLMYGVWHEEDKVVKIPWKKEVRL